MTHFLELSGTFLHGFFSVFRFSSIMILKISPTLCLFSCLNSTCEMLSTYHFKRLILLEVNLVYPSLYSFDLTM